MSIGIADIWGMLKDVSFMDVALDALLDSAKLFPFIFLTYLLMEYMEHHMGNKTVGWLKKSGKFGPIVGAAAGVLPQCGFSAAASGLYSGRVITLGTLIAVYLSTSDEMLPLMISQKMNPVVIFSILGIKLVIGLIAGLIIDGVIHKLKKDDEHYHIHEMCEAEHCCCEDSIWKSALKHSIKVILFILVLNFLIGYFMQGIGNIGISYVAVGESLGVILLCSLFGLIPNCGASVALTQLYIGEMLSVGALLAGLLVNAGVGLLVLIRTNRNKLENVKIIVLLWAIGFVVGCTFKFAGIHF